MNKFKVLVIDDEPDIADLLKITLERMNIDSVLCYRYQEAIEHLSSICNRNSKQENSEQNCFDLCLTDMKLPDGDGLNLIDYIQDNCPHVPVIVITAHGSIELAINALKRGAFDFITKPINLNQLKTAILNAIKLNVVSTKQDLPGLIGKSAAMEKLKTLIHQVARSQAPIYISGPSGVGKELVAHCIHNCSSRKDGPMITINCGAIPKELMESEFFGYTKGSFTGANIDKKGLFEAANNGTLFLDEVADLPLSMQVKLLRAIQEQVIRPIGSNKETKIDVRILCATHKDLDEQVKKEEFRKDLFYRLNVIEIKVPSLSSRKEDIPELIDYILAKLSIKTKEKSENKDDTIKNKPKISETALKTLCEYSFPGNIRELENILERAYTLCRNIIQVEDLQLPEFKIENSKNIQNENILKENTEGLLTYMETIERDAILKSLDLNNNNKTQTAKQLGLTMRALRYRLKKLNIKE